MEVCGTVGIVFRKKGAAWWNEGIKKFPDEKKGIWKKLSLKIGRK